MAIITGERALDHPGLSARTISKIIDNSQWECDEFYVQPDIDAGRLMGSWVQRTLKMTDRGRAELEDFERRQTGIEEEEGLDDV